MPDIRNCKKCGRVYNYVGGAPICQVCKDEDEKDFKRVKEYLYDNPGAPLSEVSTVLEISIEKITRFLKDGRLEIMNKEGNLILECESCGKSITTGRYCTDCSKDITAGLKTTASQLSGDLSRAQKDSRSIGMRYLNKDEKGLNSK